MTLSRPSTKTGRKKSFSNSNCATRISMILRSKLLVVGSTLLPSISNSSPSLHPCRLSPRKTITMDDAEYGAALLQELVELSQDLWMARKERQVARAKFAATERDHASWKKQLDQRVSHNHALLEQELLKQQIDAKKREKVRLLKEVAAAKGRHNDLQKRAGFDVSSFSAPATDQRRHNEEINGRDYIDNDNDDNYCLENDPAREDWGAAALTDGARDAANGLPSCPKSPGNSTRRRKVLRGGGSQHPRHRSSWNESCGSIEVFAVPFLATEPTTTQPPLTGSASAPSTPRSNRRRRSRNGSASNSSLRSSLEASHGKLAALSLPIDAAGCNDTTDREAATTHKPQSIAAPPQGTSARRSRRSNSGSHQFNCSFSSLSTRSSSNSTTTGSTPATQLLRGRRRSGHRPLAPGRSPSGSRSSSRRRRGVSPSSPSSGNNHPPDDASPRTTTTAATAATAAQNPRRARSTSLDEARELYSREEEPFSSPARAAVARRSHSVGVSPRRGNDEHDDIVKEVVPDSPKRVWKGSSHPRTGPWAVDDFSSDDDDEDDDIDVCADDCAEELECVESCHDGGVFSEGDLDGLRGAPTPSASTAQDLPPLVSLDD